MPRVLLSIEPATDDWSIVVAGKSVEFIGILKTLNSHALSLMSDGLAHYYFCQTSKADLEREFSDSVASTSSRVL